MTAPKTMSNPPTVGEGPEALGSSSPKSEDTHRAADGLIVVPPMTAAESNPLTAINYAIDSADAYGDPGDVLTFLRMWREGDLSEAQQYRDYVAAGGFSA